MAGEIKVTLRQIAPATTEAAVRQHTVLIDRPAAKGGTDAGPMGGELFLSAIGGCFMSNLLAAIRARKVPISNVQAAITGILEDSPSRFVSVKLHLSAEGGTHDELKHLVQIADRGCIMMNTLRGKLEVSIEIRQSQAPAVQARTGD